MRQDRHECNTSATLATRVVHEWHECDTSATRTIRVKIFDFDNDTSKIIFSHPYVNLLIIFTKNYLLEIIRFHAKMRLKSAVQKLNFLIAKIYQNVEP